MAAKKKRCGQLSGKKNAKGGLCGAWPLKGQTVCLAHADADIRASVGFTPDAGNAGGRPRRLKPMEIERNLMERYALAWMRPYWRILGFEVAIDQEDGELYLTESAAGGAKIFGESKEGHVRMSDYDDLGAQMAAAEKLRDRVFGRPKQTTEVTGPGGGKIEVDVTADEVRDAREAFLAAFPGGKVPLAVGGALIPPGSEN